MRRWWWLSPLLVIVVIGGAWTLGADLPVVGKRAPVPGLTGIDWRVAAFEEHGQRWEVPATVDTHVRFDGRSYQSRVCNAQGGDLVIHATTLDVTPGFSTAKGCEGDEGRAEHLFHWAMDDPTWSSADGVLRLTADGVTAELRARPDGTWETHRFPGGPVAPEVTRIAPTQA
jgi:hypothetical protein